LMPAAANPPRCKQLFGIGRLQLHVLASHEIG
jgi:hypothetical protein